MNLQTLPRSGVIITKGPQNWQIFQRGRRGTADIEIEGTWSITETEFFVQARIVNEYTNAPVTRYLDWQAASMDLTAKRFAMTFRDVPQGGLYRIETRARRPNTPFRWALRGDCVHHIGVGDLYVIAGQSNASGTGKGTVTDGPELGVHLFGNNECWRLATHPLEDATDTLHPITITGIFHGHSPWLVFGKRIQTYTGIPVGLIPTALGGSSIKQWIKDDGQPGDLSENMADMIRKAGGSITGVLWYQGESDTTPEGVECYPNRFEKWVSLTRSLVNNETLPILTAQLNGHLDHDRPYMESWCHIRELQRSMARTMSNVHMVVTIDCSLSDEVHNHAASNVTIGERFADTALEVIYGYAIDSRFPEPVEVHFRNEQCIEVVFAHLSGDWTQVAKIRDFTVEDEAGIIPIRWVEVDDQNRVFIHLDRNATRFAVLHGLFGYTPSITLRDDGGRCMTPFSIPVQEIENTYNSI
jgi:sialate O-acetylesterase